MLSFTTFLFQEWAKSDICFILFLQTDDTRQMLRNSLAKSCEGNHTLCGKPATFGICRQKWRLIWGTRSCEFLVYT